MEQEIYVLKKHWWFWVNPVFWSIILIPTLILPIFIMAWAFLRWKFDKIEFRDNCFYAKTGIIFIDKKTIPLNKISMVSEKSDIISNMLNFGNLVIESSALNSTVTYPCIENIEEFIKFINAKINKV